mgnify:CR=1 FL=1
MPDTFTGNYEFTLPEIGGSDDTWGDKLNANWNALDSLIREIRLQQVGQISAFTRTVAAGAPDGWLRMAGQTVSRTTYADLWNYAQNSGLLASSSGAKTAAQFGPGNGTSTFALPDYRGPFLRGLDDSRNAGVVQGDQNKQHSHSGSSGNAGGHSHTGNTTTNGLHNHSGSTNTTGGHTHTGSTSNDTHNHGIPVVGGGDQGTGTPQGHDTFNVDSYRNTQNDTHNHSFTTNGAGNHNHSLNINNNGNHNHSLNINSNGVHNHSISIGNEGGDEARPTNIATMYCIKF